MKLRTFLGIAEYFCFAASVFFGVADNIQMATYSMAACVVYHLWKVEEPRP